MQQKKVEKSMDELVYYRSNKATLLGVVDGLGSVLI